MSWETWTGPAIWLVPGERIQTLCQRYSGLRPDGYVSDYLRNGISLGGRLTLTSDTLRFDPDPQRALALWSVSSVPCRWDPDHAQTILANLRWSTPLAAVRDVCLDGFLERRLGVELDEGMERFYIVGAWQWERALQERCGLPPSNALSRAPRSGANARSISRSAAADRG